MPLGKIAHRRGEQREALLEAVRGASYGQGYMLSQMIPNVVFKGDFDTVRFALKLARKDVARVLESLSAVGYKELKKNGIFVLPGFAKFVVIKKPATKERQGINPFTKEPITIKAKPARKVLKARPVKAAKDSLA